MSSSRQSGSVITFVVIGLVLTGLLLGGLYVSKERARNVATTDTSEQKPTPAPSEDKDQDTAQNGTKPDTASENKPQTTTPPATTQPTPAPSAATVPGTGPSHIASTGAEDSILVRAIIVLAVGLSVTSYAVSRRELLITALR